jgi:hypothetical protein
MAKTSRKAAAKKKTAVTKRTVAKKKAMATSRTAAAKPKAAAKAKLTPAGAKKEFAALEQRRQTIWPDMDSADAAKSKRAAAAWDKFIADFEAFCKKYSLQIVQEEKKHNDEPTPRTHTVNTHGCAPSYSGHRPDGNPFVCNFVRYSRVRNACIYTCGFDPNGTYNPF